ncbi:hypothetical protein GYMLUDRAFT_248437 [Collybiopsis luxurians FD-317 M1]|uniref:Uncharacterized protein n=1 Tax=Collybiopsis luxurians FD-317 M1 TaxID=944289 RepID=A0A0D0AYQ7_9AGAR|nr:hypothetical protein GYMLUDRAFT_248437 [Collybiopsis luxurians FD-317 M1]
MSKRVFAHVRQPRPRLETSLRSFTCAAYDVDERCFGQLDFGFLRSNPSTGCEYKIFPHIFAARHTLNVDSPARARVNFYFIFPLPSARISNTITIYSYNAEKLAQDTSKSLGMEFWFKLSFFSLQTGTAGFSVNTI